MSNSSYPLTIKVFQNFDNFDVTIDASHVNEVHNEVSSIETTLGVAPFGGTPYTSLSAALADLLENKANSIHPHDHADLLGLDNPLAHPQYSLVDGSVAFTGPVQGVKGTDPSHLATVEQIADQGFVDGSYVADQLLALTVNLVQAVQGTNSPLAGTFDPANAKMVMGGGQGVTDDSGSISYSVPAFETGVQTVIITKTIGVETAGSHAELGIVTLDSVQVYFLDVNGNPVAQTSSGVSFLALGS